MTNAYKLYLQSGKYKVLDEQEYLSIAKHKLEHDDSLKKLYANKKINKLAALRIFQHQKIKIQPVNAILIKTNKKVEPVLKTIEQIEEDIEKYIFQQMKENSNYFALYFSGSKKAALKILEEGLQYEVVDDKRTLDDFLEKEIYFTSKVMHKNHHIQVELTKNKFICDFNTKRIYKYKATIVDEEDYQFNFKKNELFVSREEALQEAKKLIDEHYNLAIRNGKAQKIIVRTDADNTIIVFWPDVETDEEYIMANDVIGTSDLAGDTKTSLLFFNECKEPTPEQIKIAQNAIEKTMNLQTFNVHHL